MRKTKRLLRIRILSIRHPKFWETVRYVCYTLKNIVVVEQANNVLRLLQLIFDL